MAENLGSRANKGGSGARRDLPEEDYRPMPGVEIDLTSDKTANLGSRQIIQHKAGKSAAAGAPVPPTRELVSTSRWWHDVGTLVLLYGALIGIPLLLAIFAVWEIWRDVHAAR